MSLLRKIQWKWWFLLFSVGKEPKEGERKIYLYIEGKSITFYLIDSAIRRHARCAGIACFPGSHDFSLSPALFFAESLEQTRYGTHASFVWYPLKVRLSLFGLINHVKPLFLLKNNRGRLGNCSSDLTSSYVLLSFNCVTRSLWTFDPPC